MMSNQHIYIWLKCKQLWGVWQMGEREKPREGNVQTGVCV